MRQWCPRVVLVATKYEYERASVHACVHAWMRARACVPSSPICPLPVRASVRPDASSVPSGAAASCVCGTWRHTAPSMSWGLTRSSLTWTSRWSRLICSWPPSAAAYWWWWTVRTATRRTRTYWWWDWTRVRRDHIPVSPQVYAPSALCRVYAPSFYVIVFSFKYNIRRPNTFQMSGGNGALPVMR